MGIVNPLLQEHVEWLWFIASQVVYGVAMSLVVISTHKVAIPPAGPGNPPPSGPEQERRALMKSRTLFFIPRGPRWLLSTILVLAAAGCDRPLPGKPKPEDEYIAPQKEMRFSVLFKQNCVACHGADGELGAGPPLNDGLFLGLISDAELLRVITEGRHGTLMPAFALSKGGQLREEQVKVLAEGIKRQWPPQKSSSGAPPYLATGPAGNKTDGQKVFARAVLHATATTARGASWLAAINGREFLALISDQALRRYVITGRPDLGMPDFADSMGRPEDFKPLTSPEVKDLVALLASWRQGGSVNGKGN